MSDFKQLLCCFYLPQVVEAACRETFKTSRRTGVPEMIVDGVRRGYLQVMDCDGPIVLSAGIYSRDLMLTPSGLEFCGFEKSVVVIEEVPAVQLNLF